LKKLISLVALLTLILLFVTKSLYVEWPEIFIIIGSLSVISIIYNLYQRKPSDILRNSAIIGFLIFWIFGSLDLIIDHFLYFLPTGNEDGKPLTLGMKIEEYNDDLFFASIISLFTVVIISILVSFLVKIKTDNLKG
jgi:hypothetical protein